MSQLVNLQFQQIQLVPNWKEISQLLRSAIHFEKSIIIKWIKPKSAYVKLNSDGSCKEGKYGAGGVIRDKESCLVFAYSLVLSSGTSNWAEAVALHCSIKCAESDSKLLMDCVNGRNTIPWNIAKEVEELKKFMD
uniref:RNase H type-1 domain-containing protein n=1 Tax=Nicotiana tabacum TaxID=4097 RepID=A0A1S4BXP9_TOBAC|nr:PREDICTED: uncharacterized protein LOC107812949 [Nicotiana tabacum]